MVSHELCTPLGFIKGYATTLLRDDTTWDEASRREFLTVIDEEADRLRDLIDSLLDSSRLQAGTLKVDLAPVRLDTLLREIASRAMSRQAGLSIQLNVQNSLLAPIDSTRLAQVLDNLISNAFKYAPGSPVVISMRTESGHVVLEVQDHGPGIPPEHQAHLFERFYRVPGSQSAARGTGLGLYICRQLIQAHHGEIGVRSTLGEGTTFQIRLPLTTS
jgi:signal transduction histidine kinase